MRRVTLLAGSEITFKQTYQNVAGTVKNGNVIAPITAGKLTGDSITFTAGGTCSPAACPPPGVCCPGVQVFCLGLTAGGLWAPGR